MLQKKKTHRGIRLTENKVCLPHNFDDQTWKGSGDNESAESGSGDEVSGLRQLLVVSVFQLLRGRLSLPAGYNIYTYIYTWDTHICIYVKERVWSLLLGLRFLGHANDHFL